MNPGLPSGHRRRSPDFRRWPLRRFWCNRSRSSNPKSLHRLSGGACFAVFDTRPCCGKCAGAATNVPGILAACSVRWASRDSRPCRLRCIAPPRRPSHWQSARRSACGAFTPRARAPVRSAESRPFPACCSRSGPAHTALFRVWRAPRRRSRPYRPRSPEGSVCLVMTSRLTGWSSASSTRRFFLQRLVATYRRARDVRLGPW